jgi:hypothetical protein
MKEQLVHVWRNYLNKAWLFIVIVLALGVFLFLFASILLHNHKPSPEPLYDFWLPLMKDGGHTILVAGFFAAFLKAFQFIGIFKDAIKMLVYNDADFKVQFHELIFSKRVLQYASLDIRKKIWQNLTPSLYSNDCTIPEEINSKFVDKMLQSYMPSTIDFIQDNFVVHYDIQFDRGDIVYIEKASYDIIPLKPNINFRTTYMMWKHLDESHDNSDTTIRKFEIAGIDFAHRFNNTDSTERHFKINKKNLDVNLKEELGNKYNSRIEVKSRIELRNTPLRSPHFRYQFSKHTMGFKITYKNNSEDKINVKLEMIDDRIDLREILEDSNALENRHELLLPTDGYLFIITPKSWKE